MKSGSNERKSKPQIPEVVVRRLPSYLRILSLLQEEGIEVASSQQLASRLWVTSAQIRKDLNYFGKFGKQGKGYNVRRLLVELRRILGLEQQWSMVLVGVGRLGRALIDYAGFAPEGFKVAAALDSDPRQVGKKIGNLLIQDMSQLRQVVRQQGIDIGIVAVPGAKAQEVVDVLVESGVKAILNYAPVSPRLPPEIQVRQIDPVLALQSMTYYLKNSRQAEGSLQAKT